MLDEYGHCKLVDFGFATKPDSAGLIHTICGTPAYLSPEQLNRKFTNGYTNIVDWWSLGCLIYELLTGQTPFAKSFKDSHYEIYLRVLKGKIKYPRTMHIMCKNIVSKLCHAELEKRLKDPNDMKKEAFFEIEWNAVLNRRLKPPFIPKIESPGDSRHFDQYKESNKEKFAMKVKTDYCAFEGF